MIKCQSGYVFVTKYGALKEVLNNNFEFLLTSILLMPTEELLLKNLCPNKFDIAKICKAIEFAKKYHANQYRLSGELYYNHPIRVSIIASNYMQCENVIIAAILHDVIEDTEATIPLLLDGFGVQVAQIVEGLTRSRKFTAESIKSALDTLFQSSAPYVKECFDATKMQKKEQFSYFDVLNFLMNATKKLEKRYARLGADHSHVMYLTTMLTSIVQIIQTKFDKNSSVSVLDSLRFSSNAYNHEISDKIFFIKVADRLDNLNTMGCFDSNKQRKMKVRTMYDILPLALYLELFAVADQLRNVCKIETVEHIQEQDIHDPLLEDKDSIQDALQSSHRKLL